jgi:uncharacterized protein YcaQ
MDLSADEARRLALRAQHLLGAPDRRSGVRGVLRHLGAVQLDTISVLARSLELIPYARLGRVGRRTVEAAYWQDAHAFEYWSHAACILPVEEWPHFAFRRRAYRDRPHWNHQLPDGAYEQVVKQLHTEGPLTATELGGAKRTSEWWDWSGTKVAVERALMYGEVVCVERRGWKRVYDLAERAVPAELLAREPDDDACLRALVARSGAALGVATVKDLADYYRLSTDQVRSVLPDSGLVPVRVAGWGRKGAGPEEAWADPAALAAGPPRGRHRTTLLSPFDSLIWDRARTERVFDFSHRLEAYVPRPKRVHGYFAMPLLSGGRLIGRVDPAREGNTLVARQVSLAGPKALPAAAQALREAAEWVGCSAVKVEQVSPAPLAGPLTAAVSG